LNEAVEVGRADARAPDAAYADRLGEFPIRLILARLLLAEGKTDDGKRELREIVNGLDALRGDKSDDLTPVFFMSAAYRTFAANSTGRERTEALLSSARAWHSWPATTFTTREEQKDLAAAHDADR
jgi:hypothetical protein